MQYLENNNNIIIKRLYSFYFWIITAIDILVPLDFLLLVYCIRLGKISSLMTNILSILGILIFFIFFKKRVFSFPSYRNAGKLLEKRLCTEGAISNCMEFYDKLKSEENTVRRSFLELEINRVIPLIENIDAKSAFRIWRVYALLLLLIAEILYINIVPHNEGLNDVFNVFPKNITALKGSMIETGIFTQKREFPVEMYIDEEGKIKKTVLEYNKGKYSITIPIKNTLKYWFILGNKKSQKYEIRKIEKIGINKIIKNIIFPPYLGKVETIDSEILGGKYLKGSKIKYNIKFNDKFSYLLINLPDKKLSFENTSEIELIFDAEKSGEISLYASSCLSWLNMTGEITILEDKPPEIDIILPIDETVIDEQSPFFIKYRLDDDYGLKNTGYRIYSNGFLKSEEISVKGRNDYIERELHLPPEMYEKCVSMEVAIFARDINPIGKKVYKRITVYFPNQFERLSNSHDLESNFSEQINRLKNNIERVSEIIKKTNQSKSNDRIRNMKLSEEIERIKKSAEKLLENIEKNSGERSIYSKEIQKKMQEIKSLFSKLIGEKYKPFEIKDKGFDKPNDKIDEKLMLKKIDEMLNLLKKLQKEKNLELLMKSMEELINTMDISDSKQVSNAFDQIQKMMKDKYPSEFKDILSDFSASLYSMDRNSKKFGDNFKSEMKKTLNRLDKLKKKINENRKNNIIKRVRLLIMRLVYFGYRLSEFNNRELFISDITDFISYFKINMNDISNISQKSFLFPETSFILIMKIFKELDIMSSEKGDKAFDYQKNMIMKDNLSLIKVLMEFLENIRKNPAESNLQEFRNRLKEIMKMQKDAMDMLKKLGDANNDSIWDELYKRQQGISSAMNGIKKYGGFSQEIMNRIKELSKKMAEIAADVHSRISRKIIKEKQKNALENMLKLDKAIKKLDETQNKREAETVKKIIYENHNHEPEEKYLQIKPIPENEIEKLPETYKEIYFYFIKKNSENNKNIIHFEKKK